MGHLLLVLCHGSWVIGQRSLVMGHGSWIMGNWSLIIGHGSWAIGHGVLQVSFKSLTSLLQVTYMGQDVGVLLKGLWCRGNGLGVVVHWSSVGSYVSSDSLYLLVGFFCTKGFSPNVRCYCRKDKL